jgi:asparagine synthase (glutamine-hydrolysing)
MRRPLLGDDLYKGLRFLAARSAMDLYRAMLSFVEPDEQIVLRAPRLASAGREGLGWQPADFLSQAMLFDSVTYLPENILVKVDRAAMAVSLETRVPLLDHRIVEFAWSLPPSLRTSGSRGKLPLRRLLSRYVPESLTERPKMGFSVPIDQWLRGSLRPWADNLLDSSRLAKEGFLDAGLIRRKWHEHLSGKRNWQFLLWSVLMFQAWLEKEQRDRVNASTIY